MDSGDWISLLMVLIASASAAITYAVYRSSTDPEVIVYADVDRKRPSFINLIIKNIGKGSAVDVIFRSSRPLPSQAFSIGIPKEMPAEMIDGPIIVGIPYLAPGQQLIVTWGQYGGLKKFLGSSSIEVTAIYCRSKSLRPFSRRVESVSKLDVTQFEGTDISDLNWGPKLVKAVEASTKELAKFHKTMAAAAESERS
ncbi:hypothetical protein [Microbulbifer rhizosphaerae]|uniref:Uncharacterized protein n=1 Tax=Microbulbifer rhizosphaerae TaxID=1562603 RepID=A0A7W4ZBA8_9GAMM|nr:hypothetical protein [Microbulbifer rhizosphaerae]MBB3063717.1 hypothetical protein [Microbulbifer rhizosphaerae]